MFLEFWRSEPTKSINGLEYMDLKRTGSEQVKQQQGYNMIGFFCTGNGIEDYFGDKPNKTITIRGKICSDGTRAIMDIKCSARQYGNIMVYLQTGKW